MIPRVLKTIINDTRSLTGRPVFYQFAKSSVQTVQSHTNNAIYKKLGILGASSLLVTSLYAYSNKQYSVKLDDFYQINIKDELKDGERRNIQVGAKEEDAVLLVKLEGKYYCVSNKCPHYGAPLHTGPMYDDQVFCPWHNAAFSVIDGKHEMGPVFNGLSTFPVTVKDGQVHVRIPKNKLNVGQILPMSKKNFLNDKRHFVIVGGGVSGLSAAETLRQSGFEGEITILTQEDQLPYDRTGLSKFTFFANIDNMRVRSSEFLKEFDIDVKTNVEVSQIDSRNNTIQIKNGQKIPFDKLLIATGGRPRVPPIPGVNSLKNIFTLRDYADAVNIKQNLQDKKNVVIIGASFIGLETASAIKSQLKQKVNVTVVDISSAPYERVLGAEVGNGLKKLHEDNGIKFVLKTGIKGLEGSNNQNVSKVVLDNGTSLDADFVLFGTGITPNTEFVQPDVAQKNPDGGIVTNAFLQTSQNPNIFAAGDVASFPYFVSGEQTRVEHYNEAIYQGYIAGLNMLDQQVPVAGVPFFWTRFWDKSLQYTGNTTKWDEVFIEGDVNQQKFLAWYFLNNKVVAAAGMMQPGYIMTLNEAMRINVLPSASDIKSKQVTIADIEKSLKGSGKKCKCSKGANCHKNK